MLEIILTVIAQTAWRQFVKRYRQTRVRETYHLFIEVLRGIQNYLKLHENWFESQHIFSSLL